MEFSDDEEWLIQPFLHRGLTILAAPAKAGKGVLTHQWARSVASGKEFSGYPCSVTGKVLWINLEERDRDVNSKLNCIWSKDSDEDKSAFQGNIHVVDKLPKKILDGGEDLIRAKLQMDSYTMLVLDSLTAASRTSSTKNVVKEDYDRVAALRDICHAFNIAGIVIHHSNKRDSKETDALDLVSGTGGLAAAADSVMVLVRSKGDRILKFRSRCTDQDDLAMTLDWNNGGWMVQGRAIDKLPPEQRRVVDALEAHGALTPKELAATMKKKEDATRKLLTRMFEHKLLTKMGEGKMTKYAAAANFGRRPGEPFAGDGDVPF